MGLAKVDDIELEESFLWKVSSEVEPLSGTFGVDVIL